MSKGQDTRARIIQSAAQVFSRIGFATTSLADLMQATGLQKGGIYNHFTGKDELALEAFDYIWEQQKLRTRQLLEGRRHAADRLLALIEMFNLNYDDPLVDGGCIVLNTAIETDDSSEPLQAALRERAHAALLEWQTTIHRFVAKGIERGELRADANPETLATVIIGTLEGALMMSKLSGNGVHMQRAVAFLTDYIRLLTLNSAPAVP